MINQRDLRARAAEWALREDVVEKDYVLGWALAGIGTEPALRRRGGRQFPRDARGYGQSTSWSSETTIGGQGSSPVARRRANACSSRIGTPSFSALVSLDAPGDAPLTTAVVLPDTLPGDRPPRAVIAAAASSRL